MVGGGGFGESLLPFYHDAVGVGCQVAYMLRNFHEIVELFSIPVKIVMFLVWCVKSVHVLFYCVGQRSVNFCV